MSKNKLIDFSDFEIRYKNIRKHNPEVKNCSVWECPNPRDDTPLSGNSTCCAYHRMLFDFWSADVCRGTVLDMSQKGRRRMFTNWRNKMGKEELDKLVLRMAQEGINWEC